MSRPRREQGKAEVRAQLCSPSVCELLHQENIHFSQAIVVLTLNLGALKHPGMCLSSLGNPIDANLQNIPDLH